MSVGRLAGIWGRKCLWKHRRLSRAAREQACGGGLSFLLCEMGITAPPHTRLARRRAGHWSHVCTWVCYYPSFVDMVQIIVAPPHPLCCWRMTRTSKHLKQHPVPRKLSPQRLLLVWNTCACLGRLWDVARAGCGPGHLALQVPRHPTSSAPRPLAPAIAPTLTPKSSGSLREEAFGSRALCPSPEMGYRQSPKTQVGLRLPSLLLCLCL